MYNIRKIVNKHAKSRALQARLRPTLLLFTLVVSVMSLAQQASAGFTVSGTQLLDGNGQPFIMRGVNHPHTWYTQRTAAFADIAATGANTVRVVLSDGQQWTRNSASDVANVISLCKSHKLICVLEVHDATGSGEKQEAGTLANAAKYWVDIAEVLVGQEDYVIINIANEPFGNNQPASTWTNEHQSAIGTIRDAGLTHSLLIDAANWGQDWQEIMLDNATAVAQADPLSNTFFSVHMYEVYQDRNKIESYISRFIDRHNLPIIVGEFGGDHNGQAVDEDSILAVAQELGIGYLGWSWSGNGGCCTNLDLVINFDANVLSNWGERLINGPNGIAQTSVQASVYSGASPTPTPTATPIPTVTPTPTITPTPNPTPTPVPTPGKAKCEHIIVGAWSNGFQASVRITNLDTTSINTWQVSWSYTDNSQMTGQQWNADFSTTQANSARNLPWNAVIPPGQSVEFGYIGTGSGMVSQVEGSICL